MKRIITAIALAAAALTITACDPESSSPPPRDDVVAATREPEPEPSTASPSPSYDTDKMTELVTEMSWGQQGMENKRALCEGIDLLGTDWAAEMLREGAAKSKGGDTGTVDWDQAAEIISGKCDEEGY